MSVVRYTLILLITISAASQQVPLKRERFQNADVLYDWVTNSRGEKLRTFVTRPKNAVGKVPVIFFVGWLSCDSMEYPDGETDGFGALILRLIDKSGYATVRMNKPGVGESQGDCGKTDFNVELEGWRAAFDSMGKYDFIDTDRVFVLGMSNGGGFSPMVGQGHAVRGYIAASSWGRTWYEHMVEHERRRLTAAGKPPAEINDDVKAFTQFYDLYLNRGMTPGQVIAQHPEWKNLWYDAPGGQYGRPAGFYQQLESLNLGQVWQQVNAPVLVVHGTGDIIMSSADSNAISETVNHAHPGTAQNYVVESMDHLFMVDRKFHDPLVPEILNWMNERLVASPRSSSNLTDRDTILLADFANSTDDGIFNGTLEQALRVALEESPFLSVLPEASVVAKLNDMAHPANTPLSPDIARMLCQSTDSKAYVTGSVSSQGTEFAISLKAMDCMSDETLAQAQSTAQGKGHSR